MISEMGLRWKHPNPFGLILLCWFWLLLYLLTFQMSPDEFTKHGLMRPHQVFLIVPSTLAFGPLCAHPTMYIAMCFYFLAIKNNDCWQFLLTCEIERFLLCTYRMKAGGRSGSGHCRRSHQCEQECGERWQCLKSRGLSELDDSNCLSRVMKMKR